MFFLPSSASALWRLFLPLRCSCPGHSLELFNLFSTQAAGCLAAFVLSDSSTSCCHAALSAATATQPTLLKQDQKTDSITGPDVATPEETAQDGICFPGDSPSEPEQPAECHSRGDCTNSNTLRLQTKVSDITNHCIAPLG